MWLTEEIAALPFGVRIPSSYSPHHAIPSLDWQLGRRPAATPEQATHSTQTRMPPGSNCLINAERCEVTLLFASLREVLLPVDAQLDDAACPRGRSGHSHLIHGAGSRLQQTRCARCIGTRRRPFPIRTTLALKPSRDTGDFPGPRTPLGANTDIALNSINSCGRDKDRTCDRWCVKPELYH